MNQAVSRIDGEIDGRVHQTVTFVVRETDRCRKQIDPNYFCDKFGFDTEYAEEIKGCESPGNFRCLVSVG
jgi:hypothetical protein